MMERYRGAPARSYEADRCHSLRWAREQLAVDALVTEGPVLDCPVGTGRYLGLYADKGLHAVGVDLSADMLAEARRRYPNADLREGSVFALPFADGCFGTAVCSRLLDWLAPDDMARAIAELRRVARQIAVTLRHGPEGKRLNWTHSMSRFLEATDGLFIAGRQTTEVTRDGHEEFILLRTPVWADVLAQFPASERLFADAGDEVQRLADDWAGKLWPHRVEVSERTSRVTSEAWPSGRLADIIDRQADLFDADAPARSRYRTDERPRFEVGPATVVRAGRAEAVIDGRRRINAWRGRAGLFPVLLVEVGG